MADFAQERTLTDLRALRAGERIVFVGPRVSMLVLLAIAALAGIMSAVFLVTAVRVSLGEELLLPELHRVGRLSLWETYLIGGLEALASLGVAALAITGLVRDRRLVLDREGVAIVDRGRGRRGREAARWSEITDIATMSSPTRKSVIPVAEAIRFTTADDEKPAVPRLRFLARKPERVLALAQAARAEFGAEQRRMSGR